MQTETILTMEVIHRPTGEKRWIKASRFNPEFHIKPDNCKFSSSEREVINGKTIGDTGIIDLSALAKKPEPVVEPVVEAPAEPEPDILDDVEVDAVVNETDDLESLPFAKIKQLAKAKGVKALPTLKKIELIALIRQAE